MADHRSAKPKLADIEAATRRTVGTVDGYVEHWDLSAALEDPEPGRCRWPGCARPLPERTGRGGQIRYCGLATFDGLHPHTGEAAGHARRIAEIRAGSGSIELVDGTTFREVSTTVLDSMRTLAEQADSWLEIAATFVDEENYEYQRATIVHEADTRVAAERQRAAEATRAREDAERQAKSELQRRERADAARAEAEQARTDAEAAKEDADAAAETARREADAAVAAALEDRANALKAAERAERDRGAAQDQATSRGHRGGWTRSPASQRRR